MTLNINIKQRWLCRDDGHNSSEYYVTDIEGLSDKLRDYIIGALNLYNDEGWADDDFPINYDEETEIGLLISGLEEMADKPRTRQDLIVAL
jgi:hypothetical protein